MLSPDGVPTAPVATRMIPPRSRMGPLTEEELARALGASSQVREYATAVDRESAREMLAARLTAEAGGAEPAGAPTPARAMRGSKEPPTPLETILRSPVTRTVAGVVARGLLGALLGPPPRRRRRYY